MGSLCFWLHIWWMWATFSNTTHTSTPAPNNAQFLETSIFVPWIFHVGNAKLLIPIQDDRLVALLEWIVLSRREHFSSHVCTLVSLIFTSSFSSTELFGRCFAAHLLSRVIYIAPLHLLSPEVIRCLNLRRSELLCIQKVQIVFHTRITWVIEIVWNLRLSLSYFGWLAL